MKASIKIRFTLMLCLLCLGLANRAFASTFSDANWISMGPGVDGIITSALFDSRGDLYIAGSFTRVGNVPANRIAKWDGSSWSPLGSGVSSSVYALAVSGSDLYAGGESGIAKWNGSSWSSLGFGGSAYVSAVAVSGSYLYAGVTFRDPGNPTTPSNFVARWDGSRWNSLGLGIKREKVYALAVLGSDLYVGGNFTTRAGAAGDGIAKWNGSAWSSLGSGVSGDVRALAVSGSDLYVGGLFSSAGGVPANCIAKWDGNNWSALYSGVGSWVNALAVSGSDLYVGGNFTTAGWVTANYIAKWDGNNWSALGSGMDGGVVSALAVSDNELYGGGDFTTAGGKASAYIARAVLGDAPGYNRLTGTALLRDVMVFSYVGDPEVNYALDRAFNLAPPINWVGQQTNTMTVSGVMMFTNTPTPGTNNFWRVRSVP